jgi:hypothetical protein
MSGARHHASGSPFAAENATPENAYRSQSTVVPAVSSASSASAASHRFAEKRRWIARSSRSDDPLRYALISLPVPVVRSRRKCIFNYLIIKELLRRSVWYGGRFGRLGAVGSSSVGVGVNLSLLTWEFVPGDGKAGCGESLREELRLRGLS